jgi:hypothetical protein
MIGLSALGRKLKGTIRKSGVTVAQNHWSCGANLKNFQFPSELFPRLPIIIRFARPLLEMFAKEYESLTQSTRIQQPTTQ